MPLIVAQQSSIFQIAQGRAYAKLTFGMMTATFPFLTVPLLAPDPTVDPLVDALVLGSNECIMFTPIRIATWIMVFCSDLYEVIFLYFKQRQHVSEKYLGFFLGLLYNIYQLPVVAMQFFLVYEFHVANDSSFFNDKSRTVADKKAQFTTTTA